MKQTSGNTSRLKTKWKQDVSREGIQTAHDVLASLRAEQEEVSAKTEMLSKTRVESDRVKVGDVPGPKFEGKKSRVTRPAIGTNVGEPEVSSATEASRRAEEQGKKKLMKTGDEKSAGIAVASKRPVTKIRVKRPTSATEPLRTSLEKMVVQSSDEESMTEALGPALVVGALGRKIGDTRTATMMRGITDCRVELLSTRQKAKLPVPAVPNNSAESNSVVEGAGAYDVRLSLSATDQHVQLELPGDVTETTAKMTTPVVPGEKVTVRTVTTEPRRISFISVVRQNDDRQSRDEVVGLTNKDRAPIEAEPGVCIEDTPITPGEIATPSAIYTEITIRPKDCTMPDKKTQGVGMTEREDNAIGASEKRRMLREIDVATAIREHLAETNPKLTTATSFLEAVCGRTYAPKKGKASESTAASVGELGTMGMLSHATVLSSKVVSGLWGLASGDKRRGGGDVESDSDREMTDVLVLGDTEMSEGETSDNESGSRSSSGGSSYSSGHSRASRKPAAEDSLEREPRGIERRPFPGATSRGEGGCRIHLPTRKMAERAATDEMTASDKVGTETARVVSHASTCDPKGKAGPNVNRDKLTSDVAGDVATVTDSATLRVEAPETPEAANPVSDVASKASILTEASAGEKSATDVNSDGPVFRDRVRCTFRCDEHRIECAGTTVAQHERAHDCER